MIETIQLHVFQLFYIFICKRLILMGKAINFFNHLNVYCPVCCLLSKLNCVLWVWGVMPGWGVCPRGGLEPWRHLGDLQGDRALWDLLHPFALAFPACWGSWFGLVFFFLFFPLTLYFFSFIKSHMYFEFLWCHLFSGAFSVQSSYFLYYLSQQ